MESQETRSEVSTANSCSTDALNSSAYSFVKSESTGGALGGGQCSARRPLFGKHRAQLGRLAVDAVGVLVEEGVAVEPRGGAG